MKNLALSELTELILRQAEQKGFGTKPKEINVAEKIALIHTEVSEAYEAFRQKNISGRDGFKQELGDAVQRILHLAGIYRIDLEKEILKKLKNNKARKWNWKKMNERHS
jgi:NTP pyrophosphatase (non-canonical NTP hydrolase)